jgi:phospholipase/carboxylesterase
LFFKHFIYFKAAIESIIISTLPERVQGRKAMALLAVEQSSNVKAEYAVIWLHGLGANGHDFAPIVPELGLDHLPIHFVFPHAPVRPVTLNAGLPMPAWFDIEKLEEGAHFDREGISASQRDIEHWIDRLGAERNIPSDKIVLIGFSQGGALALYTGLRSQRPLAGVMGLSTFLPVAEDYPAALGPHACDTPFWMGHGDNDQVVWLRWGQMSYDALKALQIPCQWACYPMAHTVCGPQLKDMGHWIETVLTK